MSVVSRMAQCRMATASVAEGNVSAQLAHCVPIIPFNASVFETICGVLFCRSVNNALNTGNSSWQCSKWTLISLLLALLALAAKENGIAALPVAISWKIIRFSSQQAK